MWLTMADGTGELLVDRWTVGVHICLLCKFMSKILHIASPLILVILFLKNLNMVLYLGHVNEQNIAKQGDGSLHFSLLSLTLMRVHGS